MGLPGHQLEQVMINLDEFEAIRLCDLEGNNQIEASKSMGISRGTIQRLLSSGRAKIADALLVGKIIVIQQNQELKNYE